MPSRFRVLNLARPKWNPSDHPRDTLGRFVFANTQDRRAAREHWDDEPDRGPIPDEMWGPNSDPLGSDEGLPVSSEAERIRRMPSATPPSMASLGRELRGESLSGYPNHSKADVERELTGYLEIDSPIEMDHDQSVDLSGGGIMNLGVTRGPLHNIDTDEVYRSEVVVKRLRSEEEASAELLASEVGHAIGAPSPVVVQDPRDPERIAMEAAPGRTGLEDPSMANGYGMNREERRRYYELGGRIAALDQLTGNRDRHDGNWIMQDDGTPVAIDNGLAFSATEGRPVRDVEETRRIQETFARQYSVIAGVWRDRTNRIPTEDMEEWGPRLMALRPAFEAHGRTYWHEGLMANYNYLLRERLDQERESSR